jgi:hypothetical protein
VSLWRAGRAAQAERRRLPRLPAPIPVRYATDDGSVGVGVLVDVSERGVGLLLPPVALLGPRLWIQLLWFDDRVGLQGDVVHAAPVAEGVRVGMRLDAVPPQTAAILQMLVLPFARRWEPARGPWRALWRRLRRGPRGPGRPALPVRVTGGGGEVWAVTELLDDRHAVVLHPQALPERAVVSVTPWGRATAREGRVRASTPLAVPPYVLHRTAITWSGPRPAGGA